MAEPGGQQARGPLNSVSVKNSQMPPLVTLILFFVIDVPLRLLMDQIQLARKFLCLPLIMAFQFWS